MDPEIRPRMMAKIKQVEDTYGAQAAEALSDEGMVFVAGKLSAVRWVLGEEWDSLDT